MSDERQASEWAEQDFRERLASIKRCIPHMHDVGVLWPRDVEWLIAELERSRLDTKRLDWLEQNSATICVFDPPSGDAWVWEVAATDDSNKACEPWGNGDTLREAIDAAMASSPLAPTQEGAT